MNASYMTHSSRKAFKKASFVKLFMSLMVALLLGASTVSAVARPAQKVDAFDPVQWSMCYFGSDSFLAQAYNATQSPVIQYGLLSKSALNLSTSKVDGGMWNGILSVTSGHDFKEINEGILGVSLDSPTNAKTDDVTEEEKPKFNGGTKVSPYDRFGFAGLNFTSYAGEWKYVYIDACNTEAGLQDPKSNMYYEGRLEPRSVWEDRATSEDPRTKQNSRGIGLTNDAAFLNNVANFMFLGTKGVVASTITFVNLSFKDISTTLGLTDAVFGEEGKNDGIIESLYKNLFMPLIWISILLTGVRIAYLGIVKRQFRESFTTAAITVVMFIVAIILSVNPILATIPNKAVVVGQSLIVETMNTGMLGGNGICSTNVGQFKTKLLEDKNIKAEPQTILDQAGDNMASAIGCDLWKTFLLKPWSEGQFGTDWNDLWAKDKMPKNQKGEELNNVNDEWVGSADVPFGDGTVLNNWALFHISTTTNAHAQIGVENERAKMSQNVATDWWRIVDALSNYDEVEYTFNAQGNGGEQRDSSEVTYAAPMNNPTLEQWDSWVGNEELSRIWSAVMSFPIALIGVISILFFAFFSAMYGIGLTLVMSFLPIMMLFGCWSGTGFEIFKGYVQSIVKLMVSRVIMAVLLILSIILTQSAIKLMDNIGWIQGTLVLIFVSFILIKNKDKIINMIGGFQFASVDLSGTASRVTQRTVGITKGVARTATIGAVAGANVKRHGGSFVQGVKTSVKQELKNKAYMNQSSREAMTSYETYKKMTPEELEQLIHVCTSCGKSLRDDNNEISKEILYRDDDGNYYCQECGEDGVRDDLREVIRNDAPEKEPTLKQDREARKLRKYDLMGDNKTKLHHSTGIVATNSAYQVMDNLHSIIEAHKAEYSKKISVDDKVERVEIPAEFMSTFAKANAVKAVQAAWDEGDYDFIREAYITAFIKWAKERTGNDFNGDIDNLRIVAANGANALKKDEQSKN